MAGYLIDTHAILWLAGAPERLSAAAREAIMDADSHLYISAISMWEIAQKHYHGGLEIPHDSPFLFVQSLCQTYDMEFLDYTVTASAHLQQLPSIHKDPFDRMLICQALENGLTIITQDRYISQYPANVLW